MRAMGVPLRDRGRALASGHAPDVPLRRSEPAVWPHVVEDVLNLGSCCAPSRLEFGAPGPRPGARARPAGHSDGVPDGRDGGGDVSWWRVV